jgi:hypothetical protein
MLDKNVGGLWSFFLKKKENVHPQSDHVINSSKRSQSIILGYYSMFFFLFGFFFIFILQKSSGEKDPC